MPFTIERFCFSKFKPRCKQILSVLLLCRYFFVLVQQILLHLFTCAGGAKIVIQPLLYFSPLLRLMQCSVCDSDSRLSYLGCAA